MDFEPTPEHLPSPYDPVVEVLKKMEVEKESENVLDLLGQHLTSYELPEH